MVTNGDEQRDLNSAFLDRFSSWRQQPLFSTALHGAQYHQLAIGYPCRRVSWPGVHKAPSWFASLYFSDREPCQGTAIAGALPRYCVAPCLQNLLRTQ